MHLCFSVLVPCCFNYTDKPSQPLTDWSWTRVIGLLTTMVKMNGWMKLKETHISLCTNRFIHFGWFVMQKNILIQNLQNRHNSIKVTSLRTMFIQLRVNQEQHVLIHVIIFALYGFLSEADLIFTWTIQKPFLFMPMGWDYISELRPPMGLLFIPQVIYDYGGLQWNDTDRENWRTPRKTCPSATLSTTNPTWTDLGPQNPHELTWAWTRASVVRQAGN
jgi:hypothetical protein